MKNIDQSYKNLIIVLSRISKDELGVLIQYLNLFSTTNNKKESRIILLLNFLIDNHEADFFQVKEAVFPSGTNLAFQKIINRLHDKVFESLLLDVNINRIDAYSPNGRAILDIKKLNAKYKIASGKELYLSTLNFINRIISKAKKYELYSDLIEALHDKQHIQNLRKGSKTFEKVETEIQFYKQCLHYQMEARKYVDMIHYEMNFQHSKSRKKEFFQEAIQKIKTFYKETKINSLKYEYLLLEMDYYQMIANYSLSNNACNEVLSLLATAPSINNKRQLPYMELNKSYNHLMLGNFPDSIEYAKKGITFFNAGTYPYNMLNEIKFYAYYYMGEIKLAKEVIFRLISNNNIQRTEFQDSKWKYFQACSLFLLGDFNEALDLLEKTNEIKVDEQGWNIAIRKLTILCYIELTTKGGADIRASQAIKAFIKYAKKIKLKARNKAILALLISLEKHNFNYKETYNQHPELLQKLKQSKKWFKYEVQSPELILLDQWVEAKANDIELKHFNYDDIFN